VLLARLGTVFPHMDRDDLDSYDWVTGFPFVVRIMDYVWEPEHTDQYVTAYDFVRGVIASDESLLHLDYDRDGTPWSEDPGHDYDNDGTVTNADLSLCIEKSLLREYAELHKAIPPEYGNGTLMQMQMQMRTLTRLAIALKEQAYFDYARSVVVDHIATNWYMNDGAYYEGAIPSYGRTLCMIDKPDGTPLAIDLLTVRGGGEPLQLPYHRRGSVEGGTCVRRALGRRIRERDLAGHVAQDACAL
jgi:hypothetical protein